jgi:cytochrome c oxidase subunit 5b
LELLGRLEGIEIFDMKPLDASRIGTMKNPIAVKSLVSAAASEQG